MAERWSTVPLRVYLTGNVAVEDGNRLVSERALAGRQGRLTFAVLVAEREAAVSTDRLADVVWNGTPPDAWQTALRALMSKLRTALGRAGAIEHAFGCYQLRLSPDAWIDLEAADRAVHDAEAALRDGDHVTAMGEALVANAIARRPFLPGEAGDWVERRRERLRAVRVRALEVRGRVSLAHGDAVGAARDAGIVVELEPYRETAHVLLMRGHVTAGNPAEALATYDRLRARLADDLGTRPSPETEAVFLEVLREGS